MKSYTYASLATIVFFRHKTALSRSIEGVIRSTDALAHHLGMDPALSHMTKYRIVTELLKSDILTLQSTTGRKKLRLSPAITTYLEE